VGWKLTCVSAPPAIGTAVGGLTRRGDLATLLIGLPFCFILGWRHTVMRGVLFHLPDESPHKMRRHHDPRVRAMGVLCGNSSDGLVGAYGHWEGLDQQREDVEFDQEFGAGGCGAGDGRSWQMLPATSSTRILDPRFLCSIAYYDLVSIIWQALGGGGGGAAGGKAMEADHTPGAGLGALTEGGQDDVAEDSLTWQIVLQTHFAGFGVGLNVRMHACEAIHALSKSDRGMMCIQRACLVPLLKRLLLDPEQSSVRRAAAGTVAALCASKRGVALLCAEDHQCFLAARRQRHREWFQVGSPPGKRCPPRHLHAF